MIMRCLPDKVLRTLSGFDFWNYGFSEISSLFFDLGFYFSEKWYIVIKRNLTIVISSIATVVVLFPNIMR